MIKRPKHISVRNPQAPGPRSRSALCSRRKAPRRSDTTHFRWSSAVECLVHPMQASSRWDPTRGDHGFSLREWGYWYTFFYFDLTEGSQGTSPFDFRHYRQTRFGHARSERRRPQFTAHKFWSKLVLLCTPLRGVGPGPRSCETTS
jgi:hypothetical protein